jgi:hypothetical protein
MTKGGWSITGPTNEHYLSASGPPGGPLSVRVQPYDEAKSGKELDKLFRAALEKWSGLDPIETGPKETVTLGEKKLEAQSFRTGQSLGTTNWCIIKAPGPASGSGALFLFGTGSNEKTKPSCKQTLEHDAIAEIVTTLKFDP